MLKTRPLIYFIVFFQHFIKIDNIWLAQNHTGVWFFFRTRLHVPTHKSAWIRKDILIQIKKEMSLKLSIQNIFFFFQFGRLGILHVLHRYHQGFWDFKFTCTWTTFKWNFENAKVSVNIHEIFLTKSILHLSHFTVDQKWQNIAKINDM